MKVIVCLDLENGMMFASRRQSQDVLLREDIKSLIGESTLYMNSYSYKLYQDIFHDNVVVRDDFLLVVPDRDYALNESEMLSNYLDKITEVVIYCWNRTYPRDVIFDLDLSSDLWKVKSTIEFPGSSHEKITRTIYERRG